jgi:hypothetical protein
MPDDNPIRITPTVERQTPRWDFANLLGQAVSAAADLAAPLAASNPLLSAAVSGIKAVAQGTQSSSAGSMVDANRQLMQEGAQLNQAYLKLQHDMQQESQQYNAISNIMKVRHDSAKAAINNIR